MAHDTVEGRRTKRGPHYKPPPQNPFKPGTRAFGAEAESRRDTLKRRSRRGNLRVQTAGKTVTEERNKKNKYLMGD